MAVSLSVAGGGVVVSLVGGTLGYRWLGQLSWVDAFVNAAMLLGGMGPVSPLSNDAVKVFAGVYALYCGIFFIASVGLLLTPVASHVLHRFHLDRES
jgi:hypothetical protein